MKKFLTLITLTAITTAAFAQVVTIDDFNTGAYNRNITTGSITERQTGSMLGGQRLVTTTVESNAFGLQIQSDVVGGAYSLSSQPQVDGLSQLRYGFGLTGSTITNSDLNANFSNQNAFRFNFLSSDAAGTLTMAVRSGGGSFVTRSVSFPGNSVNVPFTREIAFSDFGGGVNFADIDQMILTLDTAASGDVTLGSFEAVPEPGTMAVLTGLALAAARRRKARKA